MTPTPNQDTAPRATDDTASIIYWLSVRVGASHASATKAVQAVMVAEEEMKEDVLK